MKWRGEGKVWTGNLKKLRGRAEGRPSPRPSPGGRGSSCRGTLRTPRLGLDLLLTEQVPLDLSGRGLGKLGDEGDPARTLVGLELFLGERLERLLEALGSDSGPQRHEGVRLDEAVSVLL